MILHGRNLIIKVGGVAIAAAKSCDISVQCEEIETASPSTGEWRTAIIGRKSWAISTNQLVTSIVRPFSMVGTSVSLDVSIEDEVGLPFTGFDENATIQGTGTGEPITIFWDKTTKKFFGIFQTGPRTRSAMNLGTGYEAYTNPNGYDVFLCDGHIYSWYNNNLHAERLTGSANVVTWRVAGTVGNLAQGSFQFNGNGALTPASLPSTT